VELGNGEAFVFDCGAGVSINYATMQIPMSKMRKIFLTHLHGDHTSDLTNIYDFGAQQDGKSPLYIFGPSASNIEDPDISGKYYDDGTLNFCHHFREMNRWHTESQSFVATRWLDAEGDGYDIFATELNWQTGDTSKTWTTNPAISKPHSDTWVAYEDKVRDIKISFFPAVHDRNGSIS
jgi:ribonuclease Z